MSGHGIKQAAYSGDGESYKPFIQCLCGFDTGRCEDWEDAGFHFDVHLGEVMMAKAAKGTK